MARITAVHDALVLTTTPTRYYPANDKRIGQILQNNESLANIYVRSGGDGSARSYIKLTPFGALMQDIFPPMDELWIYSDTNGAILTVVNKYEVK